MSASPPLTPPRNARLAAAAVAVALLIALGAIGKRLFLDRAAPRNVHERSESGARDAGATATDEMPLPVAARSQDEPAREEVAATIEAAASPTGEVRGTVRRQRDGSVVTEGVVSLAFVVLADHEVDGRPLDAARFASLHEEQRVGCHDFDEAPIDGDGTFHCRLPAPSIVRRATVQPILGSNRAPQFLETEQELADLPLAVSATLELQLVVDDGGSIEGVVVAAEGGFPLNGARVAIPWWSDVNDDWACECDVDGRFRVAGIRREVAAARSNSEAIVSCPGFVPRRFVVPPADDGLDVTGLRLALERGVAVVVVLEMPEDLDEEGRWRWREALADVWLGPAAHEPRPAITASDWLVAKGPLLDDERSTTVAFGLTPPTRDAEVTVVFDDGNLQGPFPIDASVERTPYRLVVPLQVERARWKWPGFDRTRTVAIELRTPDGAPIADAAVAARWPRSSRTAEQRGRSDVSGRVLVPTPQRGVAVELRVAGFESAWLQRWREPTPDAPDPDPLVITLRPLAPAR